MPFWRSATACWYVQIGKKQIRRSPEREEAFSLYHTLMHEPHVAQLRPTEISYDYRLVVEVCDAILEWLYKREVMTTYNWHKNYIQIIISSIPRDLRVSELKPFHVLDEMDAHDWKPNTKWDFARAVQRVFNWAADSWRISSSPICKVEKPTPEAGELSISPAEFDQVMAQIQDPNVRDLIRLCWESGCRPMEVVRIEARLLQDNPTRIVFAPSESKGKKSHRVIYLTETAEEILRELLRKNPRPTLEPRWTDRHSADRSTT
jgi:integrase